MSRYKDLRTSLMEKYIFHSGMAGLTDGEIKAGHEGSASAYWDARGLVEQYIGDPRRRTRELLEKKEQA